MNYVCSRMKLMEGMMVDDSQRLDNEAIKLLIYIIYGRFWNLYHINIRLASSRIYLKLCFWRRFDFPIEMKFSTSMCRSLIKVTNQSVAIFVYFFEAKQRKQRKLRVVHDNGVELNVTGHKLILSLTWTCQRK